jgi:hypothetical protein
MERIGHGSCLALAIACALAGCSSKGKNDGSDDSSKKSVTMQHASDDGGMLKDSGVPDDAAAATDGGGQTKGAAGNAAPPPPKLKEPPAKYSCTFGSHGDHGYWFCTAKSKRDPGRSLCRMLGADFIIIDDAAENAFVAGQISADTYIGYSDAAKEGKWVWIDGSAATYTNWDTKQPGNDDFALIEKANGKWKSTTDVALPFACEGAKLMKP